MAEPARAPALWLREAWSGRSNFALRAGLSAAAAAYRVGLAARSACYGLGLLSTRGLAVPVISIGNVTVGGSGKTPLTELVVLALRALGARPAVISRGYGRRTRGVRIVADGGGRRLAAAEGGDEPVLLAEHLPAVPILVGESRYEAGAVAVERCLADALVLDDGFQHRTLRKDLEIVAVSGSDPWGNGRLFPRGCLREPLSALKRADLVVVTNPPRAADTREIADLLKEMGATAPLLSGAYLPTALRRGADAGPESPEALRGRKVFLLAGIAGTGGFVATAGGLGAEVVGVAEFPDHHWFTARDLAHVARRARETEAEAVLTTEKDWVRLREMPRGDVPYWVLSVRLDLGGDSSALARALGETLRRAIAARPAP